MQAQPFPYIVPFCEEAIEILYEDDYLLLINKPAFLLSMPGRNPKNKDSVITRLQSDFPSASLVHRLDLDTSGIMIIPKSKPTHAGISRQFQQRLVQKSYTAVVWGHLEKSEGCIELPIKKDWENTPLQKICHEEGKSATTFYKVLNRQHNPAATRVELYPITGRTHQLRIHCQSIGHPILGCDLYASDEAFHLSKRLMLHATTIAFKHPVTHRRITGFSPLPF